MSYIFPYQKKFYVLRKTPILLSRFREFWKDRTTKCVFDEKSFGKFRRKRKWDKNWISSENSTKMFKILFIRYMETCLLIIIFKWRHRVFHEKKSKANRKKSFAYFNDMRNWLCPAVSGCFYMGKFCWTWRYEKYFQNLHKDMRKKSPGYFCVFSSSLRARSAGSGCSSCLRPPRKFDISTGGKIQVWNFLLVSFWQFLFYQI